MQEPLRKPGRRWIT